ncbi:hypothetical protein [Paenibacillus polysaccharolyticus]|uniref:hypothetical protein n=1 Tax=Paenibacillus polysaccharolyticus TaxID=582692 RepID=UPI003008E3AF
MNEVVAAVCAECNGTTQNIYEGYKCGVCAGVDITVLKDESLGGVEREYREVIRQANVGELVKVFGHSHRVANGVFKVALVQDGIIKYTVNGDPSYGTPFYNGNAYLTLEPTDIIRIKTPNGEGKASRFRMVDRKAAVGERVIVTGGSCACYETGNFAKVLSSNGRVAFVDLTENADYYDDGKWYIDRNDYRVLEPLSSAEPAPASEPLSAKPAPDQAAEIIAALTTRVTALEKRVAALETPVAPRLSELGVSAQEAAVTFAKAARKATVTVAEVSANLALRAKEARQKKRDDIVKRAKEDVEKLSVSRTDNVPTLGGGRAIFRMGLSHFLDTVKFEVNADKRTVVALLLTNDGYVWARGIAKCAPGDVFNSHIGRAISLRRALGLEIPEEYVSAPQPTEVRVGDYVYNSAQTKRMLIVTPDNIRFGKFLTQRFAEEWKLKIIDDSREDSVEPRKEVA